MGTLDAPLRLRTISAKQVDVELSKCPRELRSTITAEWLFGIDSKDTCLGAGIALGANRITQPTLVS